MPGAGATGLIIRVGLGIPVNDKQPSSKEIGKVDSVFATAIFFLTFSGEVFFATESTENSEQIFLFFISVTSASSVAKKYSG
jgi:hypothetical protein